MKTSELAGAALDWAVAKCERAGVTGIDTEGNVRIAGNANYNPSTDWAQGGPIIERETIGVWWDGEWHAKYDGCLPHQVKDADYPLVAAMRCYVASKLGDEVDVPEELQ